MSTAQQSYDVVILGGGLAGLSLALQLKLQRPQTSVCVLERRKGPAPEVAFKVGESTGEYAAEYFRRILGMKEHLEQEQVEKAGLRFFFPAGDNSDITQRVELGYTSTLPVKTYQLDRGRFENALAERCRATGVDLRDGCKVEDIDLGETEHTVRAACEGGTQTVTGRWVVDAAGRAFLLKRKLGLEKDMPHNINASWFRLGGGLLDVEEWGADNEAWLGRMEAPGIRKLSTVHLTGEGYWVWIIPLASNSTSIGIVADPRFHPFERIATFDAALDWLREHEPQLAAAVEARRDDVLDFLKVEKFSYGCTRVYSPERWCLTGEAGVFVDPLFSPGSDYIGWSNTLITDLIKCDLAGRPVAPLVEIYNRAFLFQGVPALEYVFRDIYPLLGDAELFVANATFNFTGYWGILVPPMYYDLVCDPEFQRSTVPYIMRRGQLLDTVNKLVREWHALKLQQQPVQANPTGLQPPIDKFPPMFERLTDLVAGLDRETLRARFQTTIEILEGITVVLFHKAARLLPEGAPDPARRINPAAVSLDPGQWEADGLFDDEVGLTLAEARARTPGIEYMLLDELVRAQETPSVTTG